MPLNSEDMEDYGELFAKHGRNIDRAFVSVRNTLDEKGEIEATDIKRRFYLTREGVDLFCVDEDSHIVRPSVLGPGEG